MLAPYLNGAPKFQNQGLRGVSGQRLIQGSPDILLGWGIINKIEFYVRQLRDMKGSYEFDPNITSRKGMEAYCGLCGWALALAHAKSGDAAMIAGYLGKMDETDEALTKFALRMANRMSSTTPNCRRLQRRNGSRSLMLRERGRCGVA